MTTKTILTILAASAALQLAPLASAQDTATTGQPQTKQGRHHGGGRFANLTPEERTKLRAAHQQAKADPAWQAAKNRSQQSHRELREARKAALLRADPTIQPILDKLPERGHRNS